MNKKIISSSSLLILFSLIGGVGNFLSPSLEVKAIEIIDKNDEIRMPSMSLLSDTTSSMGFNYVTTNFNDSDLFVVESSIGDFSNSSTLHFKGSIEPSRVSGDKFIHRIKATDLKEDTEYLYKFGDEELNAFSDVGKFKTSSKNNKDFSFVHLSDPQGWEKSHYETYHEVLDVIDRLEKPNFIALTGDIVNNSWANHTPVLEQWEYALSDQFDILKNYPIAPISGNHDASAYDFISRYNLDYPLNSEITSGAYYSFDYEGVHFSCLNTNDTINEGKDNASGLAKEQLDWLISDLEKNKTTRFKIILMHKGIFDAGAHSLNNTLEDYDIAYLREELSLIFSQYHVDLVLQGHDHLFSLTYPIISKKSGEYDLDTSYKVKKVNYNDELIDTYYNLDGTFYLNSGSASGSKYYVVQDNIDNSIFHINKAEGLTLPCYSSISVQKDNIIVKTYVVENDKHELINKFAISKEKIDENNQDNDDNDKNNKTLTIILSISIPSGVILILSIIFTIFRKKRGKK